MTEGLIQEALDEIAPGSRVVSLKPLHGGISATTLLLETEDQKYVVRKPPAWKYQLNPDQGHDEFRTLRDVRAAGIPAPKPFYISDEPQPFLILEFIEGEIDLRSASLGHYLERYADKLALIHRTDPTPFSYLPEQSEDHAARPKPWNDLMRETEVREVLEHLTPQKPNPPVLRHGDFWPGNVLWRDGEIVGVLDWEEALVGEPLADLAICRLDIWWAFGREASDEFTRLYLAGMPLDVADLSYWDLRAALRPISNLSEWAGSYPGMDRPDVTEATMLLDHAAFVDRALG